MTKDFYSLKERKQHYLTKLHSSKASKSQKTYAKMRLNQLKKAKPHYYKPKHVVNGKEKTIRLLDVFKMYIAARKNWNNIGHSDRHKKLIKNHRSQYQKEIDSLRKFRKKHKISYKDPIILKENEPKKYHKLPKSLE